MAFILHFGINAHLNLLRLVLQKQREDKIYRRCAERLTMKVKEREWQS